MPPHALEAGPHLSSVMTGRDAAVDAGGLAVATHHHREQALWLAEGPDGGWLVWDVISEAGCGNR
jgi:hypothetical protein